MKQNRPVLSFIAVVMALAWGTASAADVTRTADKSDPHAASVVSVGRILFPSGVAGTKGDAMAQVDEVVNALNARLASRGLGIGSMIQHTLFLKDGAASPIEVLGRFHKDARGLAPGLVDRPSVGTIIRVPGFADPNTLVLVDAVAAAPATAGGPDDFQRVLFTFGPKEIAESLRVDNLTFLAGTEAMDFEHRSLPSGIDAQIEAVVGKFASELGRAHLTLADFVSHNIYVTRGTDPLHVIAKFNEVAHRIAPDMKLTPGVGNFVVVDGMAAPGFLLEADAIVVPPPATGAYKRVPFNPPLDIARSIGVDDLVIVSGMDGRNMKTQALPKATAAQIAAAARNVDAALRAQGASMSDVVKERLFIKKGVDVAQALKDWRAAQRRLESRQAHPLSAQTVVVVEGFETDAVKFGASVIAARAQHD